MTNERWIAVVRLMLVTIALELIAFGYIAGAFRPLSAQW